MLEMKVSLLLLLLLLLHVFLMFVHCVQEEVSEITSEDDPSSEQFTATLSEDNSLPTSLRHHLQELQVDQLSSISEALLGEFKQLQMGGKGGGGGILRARDSTSEEEEPLEEDQVVVPKVKVEGVTVVSSPTTVDTSPPPPSAPQGDTTTPAHPTEEASGVGQDGAPPGEGQADISALQEGLSEGDKAEAHDVAAPQQPGTPNTPTQPQETQEMQDKPPQVQSPTEPQPNKGIPASKVTFKLPSESSSTSATGDEEGPSEATETGADISDFVSFAEENHKEESRPAQVAVQEEVPEIVFKGENTPQEAEGITSKGTSTQTQTQPQRSTEHSTQTDKEREIAVMGLDTSFRREKDVPNVPAEVPEILLDALLPSETQLLVKDTKDTNVEMESSEAGAMPCIVTSHVSLAILGLEGGQPTVPAPIQTPANTPAQTTSTTPARTPSSPTTNPHSVTSTSNPHPPTTNTPEHPTMVAPLFTAPVPLVSTVTAAQFTKEPTPERTPVVKETPKADSDSVMTVPFYATALPAVSTVTAAQFTKEPTPERTKVIKQTPKADGDSVMVAPIVTAPTTVVSVVTAAQFTKEPTPERTKVIKETPKAEGDAVMVAPFFTAPSTVVTTITADQFVKELTPERTPLLKQTDGESVPATSNSVSTSEPTPPTKTVGGKVVGEPPAPAPPHAGVEAIAEALVASTTRAALDQLSSMQESSPASTDESSASTVLDRDAAQERVEAALAEAVREEAAPPAAPVRLCGRPASPASLIH